MAGHCAEPPITEIGYSESEMMMKAKFDEQGNGYLVLTKPEYDTLPEDAKKRIRGYAKDRGAHNGNFEFSFYGGASMNLAIEICRFHHLTMESVLDAVP